jgi:histidinol phosphatase-like enzyme
MARQKRYVIDIDGTICTKVDDFPSNYSKTEPIKGRIAWINQLYKDGYYIIYWTSRGMSSGMDWEEFTRDQLASWGCMYHELWMDKPMYDFWIDDKAENANDFGDRVERFHRQEPSRETQG